MSTTKTHFEVVDKSDVPEDLILAACRLAPNKELYDALAVLEDGKFIRIAATRESATRIGSLIYQWGKRTNSAVHYRYDRNTDALYVWKDASASDGNQESVG